MYNGVVEHRKEIGQNRQFYFVLIQVLGDQTNT